MSYGALIEVVVHCPPVAGSVGWKFPADQFVTKQQHPVQVLECQIMHERRGELLHPVSGACLRALSHGYSVLFHDPTSSSRAPLVMLAVLRHCFGFHPKVGMQLLRDRGWRLDGDLEACETGLAARIATKCKLAECYQWVEALMVLRSEGGFHSFKALSHGENGLS